MEIPTRRVFAPELWMERSLDISSTSRAAGKAIGAY
jgi:hypothetical protein